MAVQPPNAETHGILPPTLLTDLAGLEEVCRLVEDTKHLLGTMSMVDQLVTDSASSASELNVALCPWHAAAIEDLARLAVASMERYVEGMKQRAKEMRQRVAAVEWHLDGLEQQLAGPEKTLDHIDGKADRVI